MPGNPYLPVHLPNTVTDIIIDETDVTCSNVERHGNYYREATLDFVVREKDKLYKAYSQAGHFNTKVGLNSLTTLYLCPKLSYKIEFYFVAEKFLFTLFEFFSLNWFCEK